MKCFSRFCILFVLLSMCLSHCLTSFATELVDSSDYYSFDPVEDFVIDDFFAEDDLASGYEEDYEYWDMDDLEYYLFAQYDEENPLPVMIIEDDEDFSNVRRASRAAPVLVIGDVVPDSPLFYGSGWITGTDSNLGTVTLYFPINYKSGYWGVDRNGYLFNVSSTSISGYLEDVYNNSVSAAGFSYPRYRTSNNGTYINLYLRPENSNMEIATAMAPKYAADELIPYIMVFLGGALILCFMKRS